MPADTVDVDFIHPRHLAGGGDPAWITVPLHDACGWSHGHDPLAPRVLLSSPDQQALLRLEPDLDGRWWTVQHAPAPKRPAWLASFGARTPVEIIAAFTDALTDPAADRADDADPREPLLNAGWSAAYRNSRLTSPDGTVRMEADEPTGPWWVDIALRSFRTLLWQAHFSEHTPAHLITAFTAALADLRPVPRTAGPASLATRDANLITVSRQKVPATQIASALPDRVRALAARHAATLPEPGLPARRASGTGRTR
ncbi:DUF317 domain-containing protein [Streptomyces tauricus]|uniref:DUF317 domain-containing protein n=1 Tax=Streptomyces tauricus TaxID=68274 RepID=A0ABZ1JR11_9ACTN|nr:DUF317 domain-containing protein [Streptomyces tauricus]